MARPFIGGYRRDVENVQWLDEQAMVLPEFKGVFKSAPVVTEPWTLIHQEHQASQGACFPAGTKVTMADGSLRDIEKVSYGDFVLSHTGAARQVVDTMRREYTDDLITLKVQGWGKVTMTQDHKVLVLREGVERWVMAEDITTEDSVLLSRGIAENRQETLDLVNYLSLENLYEEDGTLFTPSSKPIPRHIPLDDLTCFIVGLFVAEGSTDSQNGIPCRSTWTLHQDETDLAEKIVAFCKRLGLEASISCRAKSLAINVRVNSSVLADFLCNVCGRFCNHKNIPQFILRGTSEQKKAFLQGYYGGDGTRRKYDTGRVAASGNLVACRQTEASTASKVLWQQVATLLVSLGFKPSRLISVKRKNQRYDSHINYLYSTDVPNLYDETVTFKAGRNRKVVESLSGQARKVVEIVRVPALGVEVFDFTVATDHSFVAEGIVVHNCQGHALSTIAEHCIRIATGDYTQLSRQYAYIETQRIDGLIGADRGSTIWGGVKLARDKGLCQETLWQYTGKYHTKPPTGTLEDCYKDAASRKIENNVKMTDYQSVYDFIDLGLGGVSIGMRWNSFCEAKVCERYQPRRGGGHAISLLYKSARLDSQGRNYIWMDNSWGPNWGNHGWSEWSPQFIDDVFGDTSYTVAYGLTDMVDPAPRPQVYIGRMA